MVTRTTTRCFYTVFASRLTLARKKQGKGVRPPSLPSDDYEPEKKNRMKKNKSFSGLSLTCDYKIQGSHCDKSKRKIKIKEKKETCKVRLIWNIRSK
jgi:hypothetical protein